MLMEKYFFHNGHDADPDSYPDLPTTNYEIAARFFAISYRSRSSPARYELLTNGPEATFLKPIFPAISFKVTNSSGV